VAVAVARLHVVQHDPHDAPTEAPAEAEHAVAELPALPVVHQLVAEPLLELRQLLGGGWVRGCARLHGVHRFLSFLWAQRKAVTDAR
jgi:hypothetical protein